MKFNIKSYKKDVIYNKLSTHFSEVKKVKGGITLLTGTKEYFISNEAVLNLFGDLYE